MDARKEAIKQALDEAIAAFGTPSALAVAADVSPQVISNARARKSVSPELAAAIEHATKGRVTKERLIWPQLQAGFQQKRKRAA